MNFTVSLLGSMICRRGWLECADDFGYATAMPTMFLWRWSYKPSFSPRFEWMGVIPCSQNYHGSNRSFREQSSWNGKALYSWVFSVLSGSWRLCANPACKSAGREGNVGEAKSQRHEAMEEENLSSCLCVVCAHSHVRATIPVYCWGFFDPFFIDDSRSPL